MEQKNFKKHFVNFTNKKGEKTKSEKIYNTLLISIKKELLKKKNIKKVKVNKTLFSFISEKSPKVKTLILNKKRNKFLVVPLNFKEQINTAIRWMSNNYNLKKHISNVFISNMMENVFNGNDSILNKKKINFYLSLKRFLKIKKKY